MVGVLLRGLHCGGLGRPAGVRGKAHPCAGNHISARQASVGSPSLAQRFMATAP